jgi:lycopene cyclase CruP
MAAQMIADPAFVPQLVRHVGPAALADWMIHVGALGAYTALNAAAAPPLAVLARSAALPQQQAYRLRRLLDAWKWGSGADYTL